MYSQCVVLYGCERRSGQYDSNKETGIDMRGFHGDEDLIVDFWVATYVLVGGC
jgi:hypothetical protein